MISAYETQEFVPYGRQFCTMHPGKMPLQIKAVEVADHGLPLVKALKDITLRDNIKKDFWRIRKDVSAGVRNPDEELYVNEETVVWSRGNLDGAGQIIKSFTMDSPIQEALWCSFLLPDEYQPPPSASPTAGVPDGMQQIQATVQTGVCVVEASSISVFMSDGKDYSTALPFPVTRTWGIRNGLLFERSVAPQVVDVQRTPNKAQKQNLPVLFSMLHPLDEVAPVICRTGGNTNSAKVSYVTEVSQQIVFTSQQPSLVMTYDRILSAHSIWTLRRARPEEAYGACGISSTLDQYPSGNLMSQLNLGTPGTSHSTGSGLSKLTLSIQSPSISPFRSYSSKINLNSPSGGFSRLNSPSSSRLSPCSRSHSPSVVAGSLYRLQTPSPCHKSSPAGFARTPLSTNLSLAEQSCTEIMEPLAPEVCFDHLWTETGVSRDGTIGRTSKVFLSRDLCGQQFVCYLISYRHQLRCVKFEESNDRSQLIFGSLSLLQARDATPVPGLDMMVVLDMNNNLILYSGITKISQVHVMSLPSCLNRSSSPQTTHNHGTPFGTPVKLASGPFTSSRPPSAMEIRFDEELLSPVPTEFNDSSQILDTSLTDDLSFQPTPRTGCFTALRDPIENRFTLELTDGTLWRTCLPELTSSPIIRLCLFAVKQILPKDVAIQVLIRWYSTHNAPGSLNGQSEWCQFVRCLLSMMGYDVNTLALTRQLDENSSVSPELAPKKAKPSDQGSEEDWEFVVKSNHHKMVAEVHGHLLGTNAVRVLAPEASSSRGTMDTTALLFQHIPSLLFALHLVYEELKLDILYLKDLQGLASFLLQLARDLRCELYADHYRRDHQQLFAVGNQDIPMSEDELKQMHYPSFLSKKPPSIYQWLCTFLQCRNFPAFPFLPGVSERTKHVIAMYVAMFGEEPVNDVSWSTYLRKVSTAGHRSPDFEVSLITQFKRLATASSPFEKVILFAAQLEEFLKSSLAPGISMPLKEAIFWSRNTPPGDWPEQAYVLIGREDLATQKKELQKNPSVTFSKESAPQAKGGKEEEDGMEYLDKEMLKLRFSQDLRIQEMRRLLQTSRPVRIAVIQRPEVSDHEFILEQERHLYATCIRTMALPLGRGMFTLSTYHPVATETLPIPKLCLTGRAPPRNTTVDLTHIQDVPANMNHWPQFHNGVAAGLRIGFSSQVDSTWILYNRPKSSDWTNEHAGFLMGLGLNGHLSSLATLNVHDYLSKGHEMTSVALLLGIAAGKRGTMDVATTRMLSIHVAAFLPPTSTELDVPHNVQVAAILGMGFVYQGTAHRHVAEVLLSEIGRPPGPEMENCTDRESYSLAAGLALGMVMLGKGGEALGLSDIGMADQLYHYMAGGHKKPLTGAHRERYKSPSYQIKEGDSVNVDVTAPGATLALGLMYFNTKNSAVGEWLTAPDTQFLLDFLRPDFLMLRVISKGLVFWDCVHPSREWVDNNLPEIVAKYAFQKIKFQDDPDCDIDFETMSQAYCNIMAGACLVLGLKFAGSGNQQAFDVLLRLAKKVDTLLTVQKLMEQAGKSNVENAQAVIVLALSMVMAGTGNLEVMRLCRHLRARVGPAYTYVLYGSHMAISMSLGLLFLGGGRYTLSTRPEAVPAMLCAFFPKLPIHSNDNRYHLQAFRHLYVLAAEPRLILPKEVTGQGQACYVPLEIIFKNTDAYDKQSYVTMAPALLPDLDVIQEVKILGPRYWPVTFHQNKNWEMLRKVLQGTGCVYVKQRAGHLSYAVDPKGYHSVFSQSLTTDQSLGKVIKPADIKSFSSDPRILAFAEFFCRNSSEKGYNMSQFLSQVLYECVLHEKQDVLPFIIYLHQTVSMFESQPNPLGLWQLRLVLAYYQRLHAMLQDTTRPTLIGSELLAKLQNLVDSSLTRWQQGHSDTIRRYLSGQPIEGDSGRLLSGYLTWYDLPHPEMLGTAGVQGPLSLPRLTQMLKPSGLSMAAIMSLATLLLRHTDTR